MKQRLIISLTEDPQAPVDWVLWDVSAARAEQQGQAQTPEALAALAGLSHLHATYVLVPAPLVLLTSAKLPARNRSARLGVRYLLEEQFCGDPEQLHVALGHLDEQLRCPVAVIDHDLMQDWRDWLRERNIRVRAVYSELQALPREPDRSCALWLHDRVLLSDSSGIGVGMEHLDLSQFSQGPSDPDGAKTDDRPALALWCTDQSQLPTPLAEQQVTVLEESPLCFLARHLRPSDSINLLQGPYPPHDQVRDLLKPWIGAAAAAAAWVLLGFGTLLLDNYQLRQQRTALKQQIVEVFQAASPETRRIVNPKRQLANQLDALLDQSGETPILVLLSDIAEALSGTTTISTDALRFDHSSGELKLEFAATNYAAVERFAAQLEAKGLRVERGATREQNNQTTGQLSVSRSSG